MNFFNRFRIFLLVFLFLLGLILFLPVDTQTAGEVHPLFSSMQKSGISILDTGNIKWLAVLFGLGILGIFAFASYLGLRRNNDSQNKRLKNHLIISFGIYIAMYILMLIMYKLYVAGSTDSYFLGFPTPTAWMLFGVGLPPALLTFWYITKFDEWVINSADLSEFQAILDEEKSQRD